MSDVYTLHPMGPIELLVTSLRFLVRSAAVLAPLAVIFLGPGLLLNVLGLVGNNLVLMGVAALITLVGGTFFYAAATLTVSLRAIGMQAGISQILSRLRGRLFVRLLGTNLLWVLVVGVGFMLFVVPGIYLFIRFIFAQPVVVLEGIAYKNALTRSGRLVKGYWWRIFGLIVMVMLIVFIVIFAAAMIATLLFELDPVAVQILWQIMNVMLLQPVATMYFVLIYYDLRIRNEGFGVQALRQAV